MAGMGAKIACYHFRMSIYFDNSATTRVRQEVVEAMLPYLTDNYGNPSSIHSLGRDSHKAVATARGQVGKLLACGPAEVHFSACGTMSNNVAILGRARFVEANNLGKHLITSQIEHPSVMGPCQFLESQGWKVTYLPVDREGFIDLEQLKNAITKETSIVSIMWANNEIGTLQPIAEIATIVKQAGEAHGREIFMHTDAVQATGKISLDMSKAPVSALSISGHKFHAPKGVGALFLRKGVNVMPITFGGGQEKGMLPGTEGLANIVGLGVAAELAFTGLEANRQKLIEMQKFLIESLGTISGVEMTGARDIERRLPGHVSIVVGKAEGEALVMQLDLKGVCVSSASACHTGIIEPSHVLSALKIPCDLVKGSVRISLCPFNTMEECQKAVAVMDKVFRSGKTVTA